MPEVTLYSDHQLPDRHEHIKVDEWIMAAFVEYVSDPEHHVETIQGFMLKPECSFTVYDIPSRSEKIPEELLHDFLIEHCHQFIYN